MRSDGDRRLPVVALTAMVVGAMVGAGIFSLPRSFASAGGPAGTITAWLIAGTGMFMLVRVFQILAERKPDLDSGVFAYAKAGFGDYAGFLSAFGYWLVGCIADVSYWVLIMATLGGFFPVFSDGNSVVAIAVSSVLLWGYHILILRGITAAAGINTIVTVAKIVPIVVFILWLAASFQPGLFGANFWGAESASAGSLFGQVQATLYITIFVFIGVEGASVYSRYAADRSDVGRATVLGFIVVLGLMALVTLLPFGALDREAVAGTRQPSMAPVFEAVVGPWGAVFISAGLIVSVLGAHLAWSLLCVEVLFAVAKNGDMPRVLARENRNKVPSAALWLTNAVIQLILIGTLFSADAFRLLVSITSATVLVPYLLVATYAVLLSVRGETYDGDGKSRARDAALSIVALAYAGFLILALGYQYLLLSALLYAPGTILFVLARREQGLRVFRLFEWIILAAVVVAAALGLAGLVNGTISV